MASEKATYLALGDSYTIGESVEPDLRWPVQLVKALNEQGVATEEPVIVARTGLIGKNYLHGCGIIGNSTVI